MNPPTSLSRFLAARRVSAALTIVCVLCVLGWFGGAVPWWLGLISLSFMGTVHKAQKQVRRYDAWRAEWDAMGSAPRAIAAKPAPRRPKGASRWTGVIVAALALMVIPMVMRAPRADEAARNGLTLLWLGMAGYLVIKLAMRFGRRRPSVKAPAMPAQGKNTARADVVEWVLPRASSCLSRAETVRRVPDYCARLLTAK